jgi:hypothetical protein
LIIKKKKEVIKYTKFKAERGGERESERVRERERNTRTRGKGGERERESEFVEESRNAVSQVS